VPTTLPTAYDVYPLDGRHDGGYYTVKDCVTIDVLPRTPGNNVYVRSEERFSRNAETDLVCRLLLEKKKKALTVILTNKRTSDAYCRLQQDDIEATEEAF